MDKATVKEYIQRLRSIDNEIETLKIDKKELDAEFKEKLDLKAVKAALQIISTRAKVNEDHLEAVLDVLGEGHLPSAE